MDLPQIHATHTLLARMLLIGPAGFILQWHSTDDPFIPISEARHVAESLGVSWRPKLHRELVECTSHKLSIGTPNLLGHLFFLCVCVWECNFLNSPVAEAKKQRLLFSLEP